MKYCISYNADFRHMAEVDEIILDNYTGTDKLVEFIPELVKEDKSQRIIIDLFYLTKPIEEVIIYIQKLIADGYNITVKLNWKQEEEVKILKDAGISYLFNNFALNLEMAYSLAAAGSTDIYIAEELGFRLKDLQYIRNHFSVKLRVIPNICQRQDNKSSCIQGFFIRPEDTELYEPCIDVFEIIDWSKDDKPGSRLSVLYEVYKQRQWLGNINDIILDFDSSTIVNNKGINPHFGEFRINCGKRCYMGKCSLCEQTASLANTFIEGGIELIKPKYKKITTKDDIIKAKELLNEYKSNQETSSS